MKHLLTLPLSILFCFAALAQSNETAPSLYTWKGKKTVTSPGYVILKSGKQVNGDLTLIGKPGALTQILLVENGKELKLPTSAVKAYGLGSERGTSTGGSSSNITTPQCDHNPSLFTWRDMGEQMGKKIENTKPRNGYIIDRSGNKLTGQLQLKKVDGNITEYKINGSAGKKKLTPAEVANYGLSMTIAEVTKNGEKTFKDEARNFHEGSVTLQNGSTLTGWLAFRKKMPINQNKPGMGYKYDGLYFTESKEASLKTYSSNEITYVSQNVAGNELKYSPYEGMFVAENAMDKVKFRDDLREMNPGVLTLVDGSQLGGKMARFDKTSVNYKDNAGIIKKYTADEIAQFTVSTSEGDRTVIALKGELTEQIHKDEKFWAYINPNPTTIDKRRTDLARGAAGMGTSLAGAAVMRNDAKKEGYDLKLDSLIMSSNLQELKDYQAAFWKMNGVNSSEELQEKSSNESAKKFDFSLGLAIAGKEAQEDIVVYYKEIIVVNLQTNERYTLYKNKGDMNTELEGLLNGCYTFLTLDKKDKKKYFNIDNIKETMQMLGECY